MQKIKQFFQKVYQGLKKAYQKTIGKIVAFIFTPLVMMQLKNKINLSGNFKQKLFRSIFSILSFAIITALLYLILYASVMFIFTFSNKLPVNFMVCVFTLLQSISLITIVLGLTKSLYFAEDNKILLVLPVLPNTVFFSKLIVYYITEIKRSFAYMVPLFFAFGLLNGYSLAFFLIVVIGFLFISMATVVIGAILSIPVAFATMILKRNKYLQMAIFALFLTFVTYLFFALIANVPKNLNLLEKWPTYYWGIQDFLKEFSSVFSFMASLTSMIVGAMGANGIYNVLPATSFITFLWLLATIAVCGAIVFFVARPLFFAMASKPFEYKKKIFKKQKHNIKHNRLFSSLKKELLLSFRTPSGLFNNFIFVFLLPFAVLLLNTTFSSMNTRLSGDNLCLCFSILVIMLIVLTNNSGNASLFSNEGKAVYLLKTKPTSYWATFSSKISLHYTLTFVSTIWAVAIMGTLAHLPFLESVAIFISVFCTYTAHMLWSVDLDIMNPQHAYYNDGVHSGHNANEIRSTIIAFFIAFLSFIITLILISEDPSIAWFKIVGMSIVFLAIRIYLNMARAKVYFKEIA